MNENIVKADPEFKSYADSIIEILSRPSDWRLYKFGGEGWHGNTYERAAAILEYTAARLKDEAAKNTMKPTKMWTTNSAA